MEYIYGMNFVPVTDPAELWVRLPRAAQPAKRGEAKQPGGRLCGLGRTTLLELAEKGYFRIAYIKQPNRKRGIHLVHMPSLLAYLDKITKEVS
jgi:hypothetical protein